jgi:chromosome segregation ATPase
VSETKRLTPTDLARFRADYHQCRTTIVPLLDEIDALTAERDEALMDRDIAREASDRSLRDRDEFRAALTREKDVNERRASLLDAEVDRLTAERDRLTAERDRLAAACREALARLEPAGETCLCRDGSQLDAAMVRAGLRHALDALAAEGGG